MERNPNLDSALRAKGPTSRSPLRSLRRLGEIAKRPEGRNGQLAEALEADALLLREENARLRVKLEASPDVGHVIERLRALPAPGAESAGGEDGWQMLTEVIVMRNRLIEICQEIGEAMARLETSLESLSPPHGFAAVEHADSGHLRNGHSRNGHLKEARQS